MGGIKVEVNGNSGRVVMRASAKRFVVARLTGVQFLPITPKNL